MQDISDEVERLKDRMELLAQAVGFLAVRTGVDGTQEIDLDALDCATEALRVEWHDE